MKCAWMILVALLSAMTPVNKPAELLLKSKVTLPEVVTKALPEVKEGTPFFAKLKEEKGRVIYTVSFAQGELMMLGAYMLLATASLFAGNPWTAIAAALALSLLVGILVYVLLMRKGRPSEIYNVCSGRAISIKAVIEEFECISGIKVEIDTHPGKRRIGDAEEVCGNPAKIQAATGWKPVIPLKTTLLDLLGYWRLALHQSSPQKAPSPVLHTTR